MRFFLIIFCDFGLLSADNVKIEALFYLKYNIKYNIMAIDYLLSHLYYKCLYYVFMVCFRNDLQYAKEFF